MRILVTSTGFPRWKGDLFGNFILAASKELVKQNIDVEVLCPHHQSVPIEEVVEGIKVKRFKYFIEKWQGVAYGGGVAPNLKYNKLLWLQLPFFIFNYIRALRKHKNNKDLVHAHFTLNGLLALIVGCKPLLITVHQVVKKSWLNKWILEHANGIYFNSQYTCNQALSFCKPKKYWVLRTGIDTNYFIPREHTLPFSVVFVGRLVEKKGIQVLVDAMKKLDIPWIVAGEGPLFEKYKAEYPDNFIGRVSDEQLLRLLQGAGVVVLPSIIDSKGETETLGQSLVEALSCGVPVIGSNVGGVPEVVSEDVGFLVKSGSGEDLREKILFLKNDLELRKSMGENARKKAVQEFSISSHIEQLKKIYEVIAGGASN